MDNGNEPAATETRMSPADAKAEAIHAVIEAAFEAEPELRRSIEEWTTFLSQQDPQIHANPTEIVVALKRCQPSAPHPEPLAAEPAAAAPTPVNTVTGYDPSTKTATLDHDAKPLEPTVGENAELGTQETGGASQPTDGPSLAPIDGTPDPAAAPAPDAPAAGSDTPEMSPAKSADAAEAAEATTE